VGILSNAVTTWTQTRLVDGTLLPETVQPRSVPPQQGLGEHWLSETTVRNMYQNLLFAFVYNAAGVPVAAGVLYPFLGILLSPLFAAAAMSLSSVSVVGNALRLRRA